MNDAHSGSSPYPGNILLACEDECLLLRIIPVPGEHTSVKALDNNEETDHPRTRGTYLGSFSLNEYSCGSSPYPGNILTSSSGVKTHRRIIPIPGEHTIAHPHTGTSNPDHPHTRGTYASWDVACATSPGSSPYPGNIHMNLSQKEQCDRIIPVPGEHTYR